MKYIYTIITYLALIAFPEPSSSQAQKDFSSIGENNKTILMLASYVGSAYYCNVYGIEYRELSKEINEGMARKSASTSEELAMSIMWKLGFNAGQRGELFSPELNDFVLLSQSHDTRKACDLAYQMVAKISRMK